MDNHGAVMACAVQRPHSYGLIVAERGFEGALGRVLVRHVSTGMAINGVSNQCDVA